MSLLTRAIDTALDVTVIPGYSAIGSAVRRRFWAPDPEPFTSPTEIVVTGGSSGLGAATAAGLTRLGARVHLVGRSTERLESSADTIRGEVRDADLVIRECDISDLDAVARLVTDLRADLTGIHAVVHCAGVMPPERTESKQGHEAAFATHVLGPVAMTIGLRELFDADSRVVFVSSGGMYPVPLTTTDLEFTEGDYSGLTAYARTKRMQVVITEQLAQHLSLPDDPKVHSMHPGWADTPGVTDSIPGFGKVMKPILRTAHDGADTIVWLAASPEATSTNGKFWHDRAPRPTHYPSWRKDSPQAREALWQAVVAATDM
ncbi:dehydrogenase [Williamsia sp. Leaf354]|jgi:NAD(P)-dependent dehydrogenase (short-subunit alcohol dehydrogenase family)|uniref:SDR family NAD(P)-dependent oxidoreductase n=1 Tax=Williamsia sp. Leaf354 TaxID=1736349 RepID=UPI00070238A5|nr:SDR family NAD(P)-dependent oxidoreductase [Williamsia sp. Leaf354]KQR98285.1 dehydrogenase [Williamsia sp. Leaf354]